jgi:ring-1,2-phenylacetyl-CoA epoxidase subunit PaaE
MKMYPVAVMQRIQETEQCVSVWLAMPDEFDPSQHYKPGQHIQLAIELDGQGYQRYYSVSGIEIREGETLLQITVKRHDKGAISNYINSLLNVGDVIFISFPCGNFMLDSHETHRKSHYFFCIGSGITPLLMMIKSLLTTEPNSHVYLLYGSKNLSSTVFYQALLALEDAYKGRFKVAHCHSSPHWLSSFTPWQSGRIDEKVLQRFIREYAPKIHDTQYYLCGQSQFVFDVSRQLRQHDVPSERIHFESFGGQVKQDKFDFIDATLSVNVSGQAHQVTVPASQTLLQALSAAQIAVPHSCEAGICGTCRCRLVSGQVTMMNNGALTDTEVADGYVLACQSVALSKTLTVKF